MLLILPNLMLIVVPNTLLEASYSTLTSYLCSLLSFASHTFVMCLYFLNPITPSAFLNTSCYCIIPLSCLIFTAIPTSTIKITLSRCACYYVFKLKSYAHSTTIFALMGSKIYVHVPSPLSEFLMLTHFSPFSDLLCHNYVSFLLQ